MVNNTFRKFFDSLNVKMRSYLKAMLGVEKLERRLEYLETLKLMQYPKDQEMQPSFNEALVEIDSFGKYAKSQVCPFCHQKDKFSVGRYERGTDGWELTVRCECGYVGVVNTTGFRFEHLGRP